MQTAPFFNDVAEGPDGGNAYWLTTTDKVRIRVGAWPAATGVTQRGSVLLFPGRTEYIEKYGPAAGELAARGYATITIDWRGQGLAEREYSDRNLGHVDHFDAFQTDLAAMLDAARALDLPQPFYLISHSMGGCIGLRALHRGLDVKAAAFSAPMWGIAMAPALRPFAWGMSWASQFSKMRYNYAPGTQAETYVNAEPFEDNTLTTDPAMFAFMQRQAGAHPDLMLGGPSLNWLYAALVETRALARTRPPATPVVTFLGTNERIVEPAPIHRYMKQWDNGQMVVIDGAEHEVMMERDAVRTRFYDTADALFQTHT